MAKKYNRINDMSFKAKVPYKTPEIWVLDIQGPVLLAGSSTDSIDIPDAFREDYGDPIDLLW